MLLHSQVLDVSLDVVRSLRDVVRRIRRQDRDLALQLQRAVSSVALNIGEAARREGGNQLHQLRIAAGSANESAVALRLAEAWGYVARPEIEQPLDRLDHVRAMLWKLTR